MPKDLGSNPSVCHIFLFVPLRSFSATLAKRWKVQFRLGLAKKNSTSFDSDSGIQISKNYYPKEIESTVDIHRKNTVACIYIYVYVSTLLHTCIYIYIYIKHFSCQRNTSLD